MYLLLWLSGSSGCLSQVRRTNQAKVFGDVVRMGKKFQNMGETDRSAMWLVHFYQLRMLARCPTWKDFIISRLNL